MKTHLTLSILLLAAFTVAKAQQFPALEGENLKHQSVNLPADVSGKHTLVGIALSKKSEKFLKGWFDPVYNQLIKEPESGTIFEFGFDVNVYFVPMLTGAKRPAYKKVMDKVEKDVDPKLHPHVLFYKGSLSTYKDALKIDNKNVPYFYLLDDTGKIIYATKGAYSRAKLQRIIDELPFD
ncbi:TlpA family protein disulfide reductase [Marinoscillum furvescens]|uniref:ATP10 protein n=1 Tax=Marinoscillum furvescens DSM 4134 TaxID=1122208 RepID=A0A3D9KWL4_MARFU|nr:hypothetical protein [Marinoscillum furvescens]RED92660.1 ATP10 protein [Marinoscillum furvescens DSM 4134]